MSNKEMNDNNTFDFYKKGLWTGRLAGFTKTINSNLKLLRVILLTKGSSVMEVGLLLERGEKVLKENKSSDALRTELATLKREKRAEIIKLKNRISNKAQELVKKDGHDDLSAWASKLASPIIPDPLTQTWNEITTIFGQLQPAALDSQTVQDGMGYDFEETQLYNLRALSLKQKNFVEGRLKSCIVNTLDTSEAHAKVASIRKSFAKMAADIEIVQRAIMQRVHELDNGEYAPSMQARALQITDKLALAALEPFQHLLPAAADVTPITFFSQETHVQGVPYCNDVVLIGIRYDQVMQQKTGAGAPPPPPFELLAIPHEIGHYIYQRATLTDIAQVQRVLKAEEVDSLIPTAQEDLTFQDISKQMDKSYQKWCEEIFADICGCIVAGPLVTLGLLSILAARAFADNRVEDGEHPTGTLRPFILKEILSVLQELQPNKYTFDQAAAGLIDSWKNILNQFGHQATQDDEKLKAIRPIIRVFAQLLLPVSSPDNSEQPSGHTVWSSKNVSDLNDYAKELAGIEHLPRLKTLRASTLDEHSPASEGNELDTLLAEWEKKGPVVIGDHT